MAPERSVASVEDEIPVVDHLGDRSQRGGVSRRRYLVGALALGLATSCVAGVVLLFPRNDSPIEETVDDSPTTRTEVQASPETETASPVLAFGPARVLTTLAPAQHVFAYDADDDGDLDILCESIGGELSWMPNLDGQGSFGPVESIGDWMPESGYRMYTSHPQVVGAFQADLDGDGDLDVMIANFAERAIYWYEGLGTGQDLGRRRIISSSSDGPNGLYAADIDMDGDLDVLCASIRDNSVNWYENEDGRGAFGPAKIITTDASMAASVFAGDLDGDGDADVVSASTRDHKIAWYENVDGRGEFGPERLVSVSAYSALSVYAADLDGDGDLDILAAYSEDPFEMFPPVRVLAVFENLLRNASRTQ